MEWIRAFNQPHLIGAITPMACYCTGPCYLVDGNKCTACVEKARRKKEYAKTYKPKPKNSAST